MIHPSKLPQATRLAQRDINEPGVGGIESYGKQFIPQMPGDTTLRLLARTVGQDRLIDAAQKVFLTWDPEQKTESFTVQPKFEGNALDFGMVIPKVLKGEGPYSDRVPDVDEGFTKADMKDMKRAAAIIQVIEARLAKSRQERRYGYLVREAPAEDVKALQLAGHLQAGLFITKFRKIFARDEMNDDLVIIPARLSDQTDSSEYEEILPTSPP